MSDTWKGVMVLALMALAALLAHYVFGLGWAPLNCGAVGGMVCS